MSELAIETRGLTKRFGGRTVVDGLNLAVPTGSIFGFLGPNGSGKTTTVRMLLGLAFPSAGTVTLLGRAIPQQVDSVLPAVGALVEGPAFYPFLSGRKNLERFDSLGTKRGRKEPRADIAKALALVGLTGAAGKRYRTYSLGMRQRLALASALMRPRSLLVLDEPTNGLDPQGTREVRNLIRQLSNAGTTVFLSSHLLSEIDQLCTHAAVLSAGRAVAQGPIEELRRARRKMLRITTPDIPRALETLSMLGGVANVRAAASPSSESWLEVELDTALPEEVASALVRADVRLRSMNESGGGLEEAFVALTGEGFDVVE